MSTSDFVGLAASAARYTIGEMSGFPFDVTTSEEVSGLEGSFVVSIGFADNVRQLHKFLFGVDNYQVSDKVLQIDSDVAYLTGIAGSYDDNAGGAEDTDTAGGTGSTDAYGSTDTQDNGDYGYTDGSDSSGADYGDAAGY